MTRLRKVFRPRPNDRSDIFVGKTVKDNHD